MKMTKSLPISKEMVYASYEQVVLNGGCAGVDKQSIEGFNADLGNNLYKLWNRMASGSYMPPPVRKVLIAKKQGGYRPLGIPTVSDRIAQGVVKTYLEPRLEAVFHGSSFGYRPGRSAHDALEQCLENCKQKAWVVDVDIKGFFDNINHDQLLYLLRRHVRERWVMMYVKRWLQAGVEQEDGSIEAREKGTPQGGVISPLLANVYLHHAYDEWMSEQFCQCPFERYADDIVIHCASKEEAISVLSALHERMAAYGLELHPDKTRIVYCKDYKGDGHHEHESFTFLSYDFHSESLKDKLSWDKSLRVFSACISNKARTRIRESIREVFRSGRLQQTLETLAAKLNPKVRGWINYYTKFNRQKGLSVYYYLNERLRSWIKDKYRIKGEKRAYRKYLSIQQTSPELFYHWKVGIKH